MAVSANRPCRRMTECRRKCHCSSTHRVPEDVKCACERPHLSLSLSRARSRALYCLMCVCAYRNPVGTQRVHQELVVPERFLQRPSARLDHTHTNTHATSTTSRECNTAHWTEGGRDGGMDGWMDGWREGGREEGRFLDGLPLDRTPEGGRAGRTWYFPSHTSASSCRTED